MGTFKNPGGRPSKFKKRYIRDLIEFFDVEPMRKELMEVAKKNGGETVEKYKYVPNYLPTLVRFAKSIDVDYTTVYRWAMSGDDSRADRDMANNKGGISSVRIKELAGMREFSKAYKTVKASQEDFLIQNGLAGASPSAAFIFTAKNVTTMKDKVENEVNVKEVKPLLDNLRKKNGVSNNHSDTEGRES